MQSRIIKPLFLGILLLGLGGAAYAQYQMQHIHMWQKMNETYGQNTWGQRVVICTWKCTSDFNNPHMTQTQGSSWCPSP